MGNLSSPCGWTSSSPLKSWGREGGWTGSQLTDDLSKGLSVFWCQPSWFSDLQNWASIFISGSPVLGSSNHTISLLTGNGGISQPIAGQITPSDKSHTHPTVFVFLESSDLLPSVTSSMINYVRFRITSEINLWACLWGVTQIRLIEVERLAHCGRLHPVGWDSRMNMKEKASWEPAFISLGFLSVDAKRPATSGSRCQDFSAMN